MWRLDDDAIVEGRPIRARVYERKSDISPDGRWLIYAAYGRGPDLPFHGDGYTAISRPPGLKADFFAPMGSTWFGGGVFDAEGRLALRLEIDARERDMIDRAGIPTTAWPPDDIASPSSNERAFDNIHWRLIRDGWRQADGGYEKPFAGGVLRKVLNERTERHELSHTLAPSAPQPASWEWAEVFGNELLFAAHGAVYRAQDGEPPRKVAAFEAARREPRTKG